MNRMQQQSKLQLTTEEDELIVDFARRHSLCNTTVIKRDLDLQVSTDTIRRRLHKTAIHHFKPASKPFLTDRHRQERLSFALEYYPKGEEFWKKVIFCDEKTFSSDEHGSLHCWRQ